MTFGERLRTAREAAGLDQDALARKAGCSQQLVSRIESGGQERSKFTVELAHACGVLPRWLGSGKGPMRAGEGGIAAASARRPPARLAEPRRVPLIDWHTAATWHEGAALVGAVRPIGMVLTWWPVGPDAFALRVQDDAMAEFAPAGSLVIADPGLGSPEPGDHVVVALEYDDRAILRRYELREGRPVLVADAPGERPRALIGRDVYAGVVRVVIRETFIR